MKSKGSLIFVATVLIAAPLRVSADQAPALPAWMAGCWLEEHGDKWTEECWTLPRAGLMLGSGRNGSKDKLRSWEVMQIVLDQTAGEGPVVRMAFWGAPKGLGRTLFAWSPTDHAGVTFVNTAHDYPQRIRYWREGDILNAETALADGTSAIRWRYRRAGQKGGRP